MKDIIQQLIQQAIDKMISSEVLPSIALPAIKVERTRDPSHGDLACNIALALAKPSGLAPRELAALICAVAADGVDVARWVQQGGGSHRPLGFAASLRVSNVSQHAHVQ